MGSTQLIDIGERREVVHRGEMAPSPIPNVFITGSSTTSVNKVPIGFLETIGSQFSDHDVLPWYDGDGDEIVLNGQSSPGNLPNGSGTREFFDATIRDPDLTTTIPRTARPLPSVISDLGDRLFRDQIHVDEDDYDRSPGELYQKLTDALENVPGSFGSHSFLPNPDIIKLINPDSIVKTLKHSRNPWRTKRPIHLSTASSRTTSDYLEVHLMEQLQEPFAKVKDCACGMMDPEGMANEICGMRQILHSGEKRSEETGSLYYQKIFAVLVLLERPLKIRRFLREKVCDGDLPLTLHEGKMYRRKDKENKTPLSCFDGWSLLRKEDFEETQWKVNAQYLSRSSNSAKPVHHFFVPPKAILPLTVKERVGEGAHGEVFKVRFHAGHQGFSGDRDKYFALKKLWKSTKQALATEAMIPKLLSSNKHPNIISLLATLEHNGDYYLLFDWAERDLLSYWLQDKPQPTAESIQKTVIWIARESACMANGLTRIHGPHKVATDVSFKTLVSSLRHTDSFKDQIFAECRQLLQSQLPDTTPGQTQIIFHLHPRHGDIKASNVLLDYSDRHGTEEKEKDPDYTIKISDFGFAGFGPINNPRDRTTPAYAPPETEIKKFIRGNSCDIWALGCLYLEFITWHFGGKELLDEFEAVRRDKDQDRDPYCRFFCTAHNPILTDKPTNNPHRVAMVKESVDKFIERLRRHERCSQYFSDFLDLIQDGMLIVEDEAYVERSPQTGQEVGMNTHRKRKKSCEILESLQSMYNRCLESKDYAIKSLN